MKLLLLNRVAVSALPSDFGIGHHREGAHQPILGRVLHTITDAFDASISLPDQLLALARTEAQRL